MEADPAALARNDDQFLTFALAGEEYAVEILRVNEIRGLSAVTPLPNTPPYVKGVINLRGAVVPIIDLRVKFGMAEERENALRVIIVVSVARKTVGLVVDAVSDVLNIAKSAIEPRPELGADLDTSYLTGMAKSKDRLVALLDIERVVGVQEFGESQVA